MSLVLLALLLFLLFGGSRVAAAGKGLGRATRHVKQALADDTSSAAPPMTDPSDTPEPKLLPAKGQSSASTNEEGSA